MKALDHVMLWVAKVFTAAMLLLFVLPVFMLGLILILELGIYFFFPHAGINTFSGSTALISQLGERPHSLLTLALAFLWFVSVRLLWSIPARLCLGVTSGFFVPGLLLMVVGLIGGGFHHAASGFLLFFITFGLFGIVGSTAMLWVSVHPPHDPHSLLSDHRLPKPVNHV